MLLVPHIPPHTLGPRLGNHHDGMLLWILADIGRSSLTLGMASLREVDLWGVLDAPRHNQDACRERNELLQFLNDRSVRAFVWQYHNGICSCRSDVVPCRETLRNVDGGRNAQASTGGVERNSCKAAEIADCLSAGCLFSMNQAVFVCVCAHVSFSVQFTRMCHRSDSHLSSRFLLAGGSLAQEFHFFW